jgi:hypothetical protein
MSLTFQEGRVVLARNLPLNSGLYKEFYGTVTVCVSAACRVSNYTEQSPYWEANSRSVSQELPWFLWNPKVQYRVNKSLYLDIILS